MKGQAKTEKIHMNDITSMLDAGCTIIIKLGVACVLLALAKLLLAWAKPKPQTLVWLGSNGVTTGNAAGTPCQFLIAEPQPEAQKLEEPEQEVAKNVVCGNCNQEIKSRPIDHEANGRQIVADIYHCENCGMRARVALAA